MNLFVDQAGFRGIKLHRTSVEGETFDLTESPQKTKHISSEAFFEKHNMTPVESFNQKLMNDRRLYNTDSKKNTVISARLQKTLDSINDPLLKIKRSVERFGRELIDVV